MRTIQLTHKEIGTIKMAFQYVYDRLLASLKITDIKNFKKALGIGIIATLFMGVFVWMVQYSSLEIVLCV